MLTISFDKSLLAYLTPHELAELDALIASDPTIWRPLPGPQTTAYNSTADIIGYGGAAGGGKTDLACGKALTRHRKSMILRRIGTELTGVVDRLEELIGSRDGYNGQSNIWRRPGLQIEFGAVPNAGDERKFQGRPHDLLVFDEATNFLVQQVRFLLGWLRTTIPGQRCQALFTFNPPTSAEGRWVIDFFAPWLDKKYPNPAQPGELRWAASLPADAATPNGRDLWVPDGRKFVLVDGQPCYDFNPMEYSPDDIITPMSRTFIPSRITDNPYLLGTGYMAQLQALPEPLRSQMLKGDFTAGIEDDPWQVIPTTWVEAAQARWKRPDKLPAMDSLGVDVARGGRDQTIIARRHGMWFDSPLTYPGSATPDGPTVAGLTIAAKRDDAVTHIDVIGVGSSPYDFLNDARQQVVGVNVAESATTTDISGRLRFKNLRSQLWWKMREALDPTNNTGIALPPDPRLLADLCAPTWTLSGSVIQVASREQIIDSIGRSPDFGSAYILALIDTPKRSHFQGLDRSNRRKDYDPYA
ncbi:MAG: terminase [Gammaproteobacteria bacterium]|nr:terminase [Gammaproteobacteria bacterium]MBU1732271.1 terminase [Gammaproteobacteria bacterium]MBU1893841.1 terminase [Gammaproteobacteria bacterium]